MTSVSKIEIINKLSEDEFFCMFETLVKNQNFDNVTRYNNKRFVYLLYFLKSLAVLQMKK